MSKAEKAPHAIEYALACVHMVVNHAILAKYHPVSNPVYVMARGSRPKYDNKQIRFSQKMRLKSCCPP